jgi:thiol:disulfide interchange protein
MAFNYVSRRCRFLSRVIELLSVMKITINSQLFTFILLLLFLSLGTAAQDPAKWSLSAQQPDATLRPGESAKFRLSATIEPGWHLYSLDQPEGGPIPMTIKITGGVPAAIDAQIRADKPKSQPDPNFIVDGKPLETRFYTDRADFEIQIAAEREVRLAEVAFDVRYQLCNDTFCLPPRTKRVSLAGESPATPSPGGNAKITGTESNDSLQKNDAASQIRGNKSAGTPDLWTFLWLAATLGAISLLTPCVFPMIPITVSYFANHSHGSRARSVRMAAVYSFGIIATFTLLGMLLAVFVGAAGINLFAANPWVNILIAAIFLAFAFNLFGAYEITVPAGVLSRLDALTRSQEGEGSGIIGALLMGLTFTMTSLTCTSPFVGTILVSASQGNWQMPLIGMLAFSTVFAIPFFILALVPQWISQLPRAGSWMSSVKVTMGFLEVAAAMKFISNVDLVWKWGIFTRTAVLAIWIAIGITLALYLLGKFQLKHDSKPERIGSIRLLAAILSLAVSFYLMTGLWGNKLGEIEAFLPPETEADVRSFGTNTTEPVWIINDFEAALARAKAENKLIFIDFTGYTCTNCRWMEANIFTRPAVRSQMEKYILVRLYTDGDGEIYRKQQKLEEDMFGTVALPFYAILNADKKPLATFPGLTRNEAEFVDFLKKPLEN